MHPFVLGALAIVGNKTGLMDLAEIEQLLAGFIYGAIKMDDLK